jgi:uracil-DNA glycosylase
MSHTFDPGYGSEPCAALVGQYPGPDVYPPRDFRVEWGPVFHRGRLDGTARVLVLGQDPGAHEAVVRRILVGEAGQRAQGLLAKLGIESSYVLFNAFLYSVYGQGGGERHKNNAALVDYRNRWLDALLVGTHVQAVIALGRLADDAFRKWQATPTGQSIQVAYAPVAHPTYPESSSGGNREKKATAMKRMLAGWNQALQQLAPHVQPDAPRNLVLYGETLTPADLAPIPERDMPPGLPPWMRSLKAWAARKGDTPDLKRATLVLTVPKGERDWPAVI